MEVDIPQVEKLLQILEGELNRHIIHERLGLLDRGNFWLKYLQTALVLVLIEMTIPDKPKSSKQKYRLTEKGKIIN